MTTTDPEKMSVPEKFFWTISILAIALGLMAMFSSCTNVSMVHSVGSTDTLEDTSTPTVSPTVTVPVKAV